MTEEEKKRFLVLVKRLKLHDDTNWPTIVEALREMRILGQKAFDHTYVWMRPFMAVMQKLLEDEFIAGALHDLEDWQEKFVRELKSVGRLEQKRQLTIEMGLNSNVRLVVNRIIQLAEQIKQNETQSKD